MKIVMISQPMNGFTPEEIVRARNKAIKHLKAKVILL